jgi:hypothetical protein
MRFFKHAGLRVAWDMRAGLVVFLRAVDLVLFLILS